MYWIYDIPTWLFGLLTISTFVLVAFLGLIVSRRWAGRIFRLSDETNEAVNGFFAGVGVMYSLLLGLVAVAAWQNYDSASATVNKEAELTAALYRDVCAFPEAERHELQNRLERYLHFVIDVAFPAHRRGEVPTGGTRILSDFQSVLTAYQPATANQQIMLAEAFAAFNRVVEARRMRMDSVNTGIPSVFWIVILAGAILSIMLTYMFHLPSLKTHLLLTGIFSLFLGLVIFLIAALDNPFRGEMGVSPEAYASVLKGLKDLDPAGL
jgi:hypothetical protein